MRGHAREREARAWRTKDRAIVRAATALLFAWAIYLSTQVHHTLGELALTSLTGGLLLVSPDILEALAAPEALRRLDWLGAWSAYLWLLLGCGLASVVCLIAGAATGDVRYGAGRWLFILGIALVALVLVLGLVPLWAAKSVRDVQKSMTSEEQRRLVKWFHSFEDEGWPTLLGAVLIIAGTVLQFISIA